MICIDSSVLLGYLLAEAQRPSTLFWASELVSSRLLEYEVWIRQHARQAAATRASEARTLLAGIALIEMSGPALARALEPWPMPVRTLDALHLATMDYMRRQGEAIDLASYDNRLLAAAEALGIPPAAL